MNRTTAQTHTQMHTDAYTTGSRLYAGQIDEGEIIVVLYVCVGVFVLVSARKQT